MKKTLAFMLIFVFLALPWFSMAYVSLVPVPAGGFPTLCADPTSCAIVIGIQVFLKLFGSKLSCLFGSEKDLFAAGFTAQTVVQDGAYDNLPGIKSLTDTKGPFGGQILSKQKCKCGGKLGVKEVIMVGPPRRTMVAVTSSTKIYDYRSFNAGNWVLGIATGDVVCRIPKALGIAEIGTSK
jgi:hypothetical protein